MITYNFRFFMIIAFLSMAYSFQLPKLITKLRKQQKLTLNLFQSTQNQMPQQIFFSLLPWKQRDMKRQKKGPYSKLSFIRGRNQILLKQRFFEIQKQNKNENQNQAQNKYLAQTRRLPINYFGSQSQDKSQKIYKSLKNERKILKLSPKQSLNVVPSKKKKEKRLLQSFRQVEVIKNGDFSSTSCKNVCCVWNTKNFKSNNVLNWQPYPQIEVGYADYYISGSGKSKATELAGSRGTCIRQLIKNISQGIYTLRYTYGAKSSLSLSMAQVNVYLNDCLIDKRTASHSWDAAVIENITIVQDNGSYYFKMCGNLSAGVHGVAIANVSFKLTAPLVLNSSSQNLSQVPALIPVNDSNLTSASSANSPINILPINNSSSLASQDLSLYQSYQSYFNDSYQSLSKNESFYSSNQSETNEVIQTFLNEIINNSLMATLLKSAFLRKISTKGFIYLVNIDHIWLYIFQPKVNSERIDDVLYVINKFQDCKWDFIPTHIQNEYLHFSQIKNALDVKIDHTPNKFLITQGNSRTFLCLTYKFFLVNIPLTIFICFVLKIFNKFFVKIHFSNLLHNFEKNSFFIIVLLESNSESFTYYLISDILTLFCHNFYVRIINFISILIFFCLISLFFSLPFILKYLYQEEKKVEFYQKCKSNLRGTVYFMVDFGLFNFLLGSTHIVAENTYLVQLKLLFCVQVCFFAYTILCLKQRRCVLKDKMMTWIMMWGVLVRLIVICSLFYYEFAAEALFAKIDLVQELLMILYMLLLIFSIAFLIFDVLRRILLRIYEIAKNPRKNCQLMELGSQKKRVKWDSIQNELKKARQNVSIQILQSDLNLYDSNDLKAKPQKIMRVSISKEIKLLKSNKTIQTMMTRRLLAAKHIKPKQKTLHQKSTIGKESQEQNNSSLEELSFPLDIKKTMICLGAKRVSMKNSGAMPRNVKTLQKVIKFKQQDDENTHK